MDTNLPRPANWIAGALAGIFAGVIATVVQLILWWAASYPPMDMLLRDARLAAAIVMGRAVLPPPVAFDWTIMLVASLVHGALSIAYGVLLAPLAAKLPARSIMAAGGLAGLLLYMVNMHGFTLLFPWFAASRDWITVAAHVSFGMSAALAYKYWGNRIARRSCGARK